MKQCRICKEVKELNHFSLQKSQPDGMRSYCKSCANTTEKKRQAEKRKDPEWVEKERKRGREKHHRLYKETYRKPSTEEKRETIKRYYEKFPEKKMANSHSAHLKPKVKGNHLHHWSYNKEHWKDCIELSIINHNKLHRYIIYDQERMMYRTLDGLLLDTKDLHIKYMEKIIDSDNSQLFKCTMCEQLLSKDYFFNIEEGNSLLCKNCYSN